MVTVMRSFGYRLLFMLLLLVVDWYFHTSFGNSPFTGPMCSTAANCPTFARYQNLRTKFEDSCCIHPVANSPAVNQEFPSSPTRVAAIHRQSRDQDMPYFFMSMQC